MNKFKHKYSFLHLSNPSSLKHVFDEFKDKISKDKVENLKFRRKRNLKQTFTIENNNTIEIQNNSLKISEIGDFYFRSSKEYKKIISNDEVKINNVTIKLSNGKYYAVFNLEIPEHVLDKKIRHC